MRWPVRLLVAGCALSLAACGSSSSPRQDPVTRDTADAAAVRAATAFLHTYVDPDGRVVRRDQGGDTVSEGQAYALLLAVAVGDQATFDRVWGWTRANLQQPDGLLAYHWAAGTVADSTPAADADSQAAWALSLAGTRFHSGGDTAAARELAVSVADLEIGYADDGGPLLAAYPDGRGATGQPAVAEPGYWAPPAAQALASLTGDSRWGALTASEDRLLTTLTRTGAVLPADWITVGAGTAPMAVKAPSGGASPRSALDGQRALVWAALDPAARSLDAAWWRRISKTADAAPLARRLDGRPLVRDASPLSAVAAAAAARSAGDQGSATRLLGTADGLAARYPTYYGAAWDALGRILLTTDRLTG